jgi:hypothetical protein
MDWINLAEDREKDSYEPSNEFSISIKGLGFLY